LRAWRDPQWAIGHGTRFARQWLRRQGWGGLFTR
jgi:hypothetical protein